MKPVETYELTWNGQSSYSQDRTCYFIFISTNTSNINPSGSNPGRREKINLIFYFNTSLWCLKMFYEVWNIKFKLIFI